MNIKVIFFEDNYYLYIGSKGTRMLSSDNRRSFFRITIHFVIVTSLLPFHLKQ